MADIKKFLDQAGVSTLWSKVAEKVAAEEARAKAAEEAAAAAAAAAQTDVDNLETYVGVIPEGYTETNIVAYIQKKAQEVLSAVTGDGEGENTINSVLQALNDYIALNDPKVQKNADDIAEIVADYLTSADKEELAEDIAANAEEILRIDNALKAAVENDGEGLDSIKELATWIEEHGKEAAGYAAAIDALELLVGDTAVATQIANAIAAENLAQYAKAADLVATNENLAALSNKVDTGDKTVTAYVTDAIAALKIGDYATAADLTKLVARVATLEGKVADLEAADVLLDGRIGAMEAKVSAWDAAESNAKAYADSLAKNYDAAGSAATAEANAKAYADSLAANYDSKGAADQALIDAKAYSDANLVTAKAHSDANLVTAKAYSDTNLATAKAYSDANLVTAKAYTDTEVAKIQALSADEILAAINSVSATA